MVQLKYFGDSRDYFKYDLITCLLGNDLLSNYVFVPMLTNHRVDGEGNIVPRQVGGKSLDLLSFIGNCGTKDLNHWETWLKPYVANYRTMQPVNETFFRDDARPKYWRLFSGLLSEADSLVFIDPDTGLETGTQSYMQGQGREKYIGNGELDYLFNCIDESSVLMIYQHLPRNKKMHEDSVSKKIGQAVSATNCQNVVAYRENDLAFIFLGKNESLFLSLSGMLENYLDQNECERSSIHYACGAAPNPNR
jgi:hypothetical protein